MEGKLSASSLSTFLKSPKSFYWRYIKRLEPIGLSVASYDHDKLAGSCWSQFVDRFYKGIGEQENTRLMLETWAIGTEGWVPPAARNRLTTALTNWAAGYYQQFSCTDGCRTHSELLVENEKFIGYLDGLSAEGVVHECKSTSRSPQLAGQLWKVQNSLQVKLYCVLTEASGVCIEFAWKDTPHAIFRAPVVPVTAEQRRGWKKELDTLADLVYSLGDAEENYPCHPDGCCLVTKGITSMCPYEILCSEGLNETTTIAFKPKEHRK